MISPHRHRRGFTLIELLVVIVIIGVLAGITVLSMAPGGPDKRLRQETQRLLALLRYAAEDAVLTAREIGVRIEPDGYAFTFLDGDGWLPVQDDDLLRERRLPDGLRLELWLDGIRVSLDGEADQGRPAPQLLLLSSGETTAFELRLRDREHDIDDRLRGDAFGGFRLIAGEMEAGLP